MDWLFKRYANPFPFMDGMILTGRFADFVDEFVAMVREEREEQTSWEFYLHKVVEGSFQDFRENMRNEKLHKEMSGKAIETALNHSMDILNNFNPERGEDDRPI